MAARRLATIPAFLLLTLLVTLALPVLLPLALLLSLVPACRGAVPTLLFIAGYLWCETLGVLSALYLWLRHRDRDRFLTGNYRLQCWWASSLMRIARVLFRLRFHIDAGDALEGAPAIVLPRHASIADTVIPMVFYAIPQRLRLRYVLKKELLFDPCLDIVGNRLPNYFVDRGGQDSERARRGVAGMVRDLGPNEGALIYPEGTRSSEAKRAALRRRYADSPEMLAQLDRWSSLLPPRLGGTLALLGANPGRDLLFCAHVGFEGSSHFRSLLNGAWVNQDIRIRFWRVAFADIPTDPDAHGEFVFTQWDRMAREVEALAAQAPLGNL
ncbi:MAG: 1-acyl-sn-glycerol-3-phosphate acyltransferase [Pseudomonadales bacterium]